MPVVASWLQVAPPFVEVSTEDRPSAQTTDGSAAIAWRVSVSPDGMATACQVAPPSVVASNCEAAPRPSRDWRR